MVATRQSRFKVEHLEERIAPAAFASVFTSATRFSATGAGAAAAFGPGAQVAAAGATAQHVIGIGSLATANALGINV